MAFFQDPPELGNTFTDDATLQSFMRRHIPEETRQAIEASLHHMGALAGGPLLRLALEHRRDEPVHIPYSPWGQRIDEVRVNPAWKRYAEVAAQEGLIATAYERQSGAFSRFHQFALVYLFDPSSQVYTCPLAMTDGAARTIEVLGDRALKETVLPHLLSRSPQEAWTSGQWMTERTGGSDVGLSETVARKTPEGYRLYGTKWFTSAVTSQVSLTLARPEGNPSGGRGLALFFVKLRDDHGVLQGIEVHRLKEKLGTRALPTAELTLHGTPALPVAGLQDGVRNMRYMLNLTRTWNAVSSVAAMQRGLMLARSYAAKRVAFGAALGQKPLHVDTLAGLAAETEAAFHLVFHNVLLMGKEETEGLSPSEEGLLRVLQPITKLVTAKQAVHVVQEVIEAFGGAGYIEDTGLPTLMRDTHVLPIWEGTTNVLSLETLRAMQRTDGLSVLLNSITETAQRVRGTELDAPAQTALGAAQHAARWLEDHQDDRDALEAGARRCAMTLGRSFALALLVDHAQWRRDHEGSTYGVAAARRFASHTIDGITDVAPHDSALLARG